MRKLLQKIKNINLSKKKVLFILPIILVGLFLIVSPVEAADWANKIVANILGVFITALGYLLTLVIKGLIYIASFSTFLDSGAVSYGWVLVRDICNMFFVVILLLIAFGTILNIEKYNYKKWLPKLILMAVLINFSKTICGLLIDIAQVVMLTFVNAFAPVAGGSMVSVLGIDKMLTFDRNPDNDTSIWIVVSAYLLAIIYLVVALIVIATMMVMLVIRVVMIWIYVVLSPLAYLLSAFPGGQNYSSQWWSGFIKELIAGPVLAFFIWLSFAALQADEINNQVEEANNQEGPTTTLSEFKPNESDSTEAATPAALIKFVIAIGMFVGGLKIAQEVGGAAGSVAGKGMNAVNKAGKIGMGGVAAVTGYRAAKKIGGNYMAARKKKREDKYQRHATQLAGGIGNVKSKIGKKVSKGKDYVKDNIMTRKIKGKYYGASQFKKRANDSMKEASQKRSQISQMQDNLGKRDGKIEGYTYDKKGEKWVNDKNPSDVKYQDEMREMVNTKSGELEEEATKQEEYARDTMKKQKLVNTGLRIGSVVTGLAGAAVTGGAGLGVAGIGIAGAGIAGAKDNKNWGKIDKSIGSDWGLDKVKDKKSKLKDSGNEEVLAKMDDQSLDRFDRAAASLEAMERGLISSNQADNKREEIKSEFGGEDKETGGFKDKKMGNYFDAVAEKSYTSATQRFKDFNADPNQEPDEDKRKIIEKRQETAEQRVKNDFSNDRLELNKIDTGAINEKLVEAITSVLDPEEISRQFKRIKDPNKKEEYVNAFRKVGSKDTSKLTGIEKSNAEADKLKAMKSLSAATDLDTATKISDNPTEVQKNEARQYKRKIIKEFGSDDIQKAYTSSNKKQGAAIDDAFSGMSSDEVLSSLGESTRNIIESNSPQGKSLRGFLKIGKREEDKKESQNEENQKNKNEKGQNENK